MARVGKKINAHGVLVEKPEKDILEDLCVVGSIILKWAPKKWEDVDCRNLV